MIKKIYLIAVFSVQILCSCTSGDNKTQYYHDKKKPKDFSHLAGDYHPKLTSNQRISPLESSYPAVQNSRKFVLKNSDLMSDEVKTAKTAQDNELNFANSEDNFDNEEDGPEVVSSDLDSDNEIDGKAILDSEEKPVKKYSGTLKIGTPYKIDGITYYPEKYENFEEVGQASWYGDEFDGKRTANGEIYNMGDITAAHRTLPLPSIVKITNLDNGKSVVVRVNDRGPFSSNRIIDVSQKAAEQLGFKNKGTANVKVQFLKAETKELWNKIIKESKEKND